MPDVAVKFDSPAKLALGWITPGAGPNATNPTVDANGLRIDTRGKSAANAGGAWSLRFPTRFGEHSHFSVRWRFRVNDGWLTRFLKPGGVAVDGGAKIAIISDARGTSVENKLVIEVNELGDVLKRFIVAYGYSGGSTRGYQAEGGGSERYQNARDDAGQRCRFNYGGTWDISGCACVTAGDWLDFLVDVETLGRLPQLITHWDQRLKVSVGYNGAPRSLLIDYHEGTPGYVARGAGDPAMDYRFDAWTGTNYVTEKDQTVDHPLAQAWYDDIEVVNLKGNPVSVYLYVPAGTTVDLVRADPPAPGPDNPPTKPPVVEPPVVPPVVPPIIVPPDNTGKPYPAWRKGRAGDLITIAGTERLSGVCPPEWTNDVVDLWNGFASFDDDRFVFAAPSGHGRPENPVIAIGARADVPRWAMLDRGSDGPAVTLTRRYKDGRACSRHTYRSTQPVSAAHAIDGQERVLLVGAYATYGTAMAGAYQGGPQVDGYLMGAGKWEAESLWSNAPIASNRCSVCRDPRDGAIFIAGNYSIASLSVKTASWSEPWYTQNTRGKKEDPIGFERLSMEDLPSLIDVSRNRWVGLTDGRPYYGPQVCLQVIDLASKVLKLLPVSGDLTAINGGALVHNLDADRYVYLRDDGQAFSIHPAGVSVALFKFPLPANGILNRAAFSATLGAIVFLPSFATPLQAFLTR